MIRTRLLNFFHVSTQLLKMSRCQRLDFRCQVQGNAYIFNLEGEEISRLKADENIIFDASFSPNSKLIATQFKTERSDTIIWDLLGRPIGKIPG